MNFEVAFLKEHSKANTIAIANYIGNSQKNFDAYWKVFMNNTGVISQRASWVLQYTAQKNPSLITNYWHDVFTKVNNQTEHEAIRRQLTRLMEIIAIPAEYEGFVADYCIRNIDNPNEAIAVRAFSINIMVKLCKKYPEFVPEVKTIIEHHFTNESIAFKSSSKRFLKAFGHLK